MPTIAEEMHSSAVLQITWRQVPRARCGTSTAKEQKKKKKLQRGREAHRQSSVTCSEPRTVYLRRVRAAHNHNLQL